MSSIRKRFLAMATSVLVVSLSLSTYVQASAKANAALVDTDASVHISLVAYGLYVPWGMVFLDDKRVLITERKGKVKIADITTRKVAEVTGTQPVFSDGQGGLLDVAKNPFKQSDWLYFTYSKQTKQGGATTLARAKLKGNALVDWADLIVTQSISDTTRHFGSRISFADADTIFFTVGDRGVRPNGQRLDTHAGKILRVDLNGAPKNDNPFVDNKNVLPEIWSYGHRNPQGIVYDTGHKRLWAIEHGPRGGDELNLIKRGANYGWAVVSHGKEYWGPFAVGEATEKAGMENPRKVYIPSIAPSSLLLYTGKKIPEWTGSLFAGALAQTHVNRLVVDKAGNVVKEERLLEKLGERIRNVIQGPDEFIYLSTDNGNIYQIKPN